MALDRRIDRLGNLLKFYEAFIDDIFKRVEILEAVISKDPSVAASVFPYLFHRNVRKHTLEVLKGFNSCVIEGFFEEDLHSEPLKPE